MKKHPYIFATLVATLLSIVVWLFVPKEYTAFTKLSDEYKEVDLAIGLDHLKAHIRNLLGSDKGMNDIEVYCQVLKTDDFARKISQKQVDGKGMTFGQYLGDKDTIEAVKDRINYNISVKNRTLFIGFTDEDPLVAAQMLDSVTVQLQDIVTQYRQYIANQAFEDARREEQREAARYHKAQKLYARFADSHQGQGLQVESQQEEALRKDVLLTYKSYRKATEKTTRQRALKQRAFTSFAIIRSNSVPMETSNSFFSYWSAFVLMALALAKALLLYQKRRKERAKIEWGGTFSPWSITLLVWGGMMVMFIFSGSMLDPLTEQFYISVSLWITILVITSFVTFNLLEHKTKPLPLDGIKVNNGFYYFFFAVALIISPMYLYKVWQTISAFGSKDMMNNVRTLAVYGEGYGFLNYAIVIAQSMLVVSLWRYPKIPKWQLVAIILCCIINSVAIMEKGSVFLVIFCSMYVLFERKVIKYRTILVVGIIIVVFFHFINLIRSGEDSDYSKEITLLDFIGMYIMSPPVAYCRVVEDVVPQFGANTFETIYLFLNRFGIGNYEVHEKLQEFVLVPIFTNVYTIMQPFYRDFGYLGVAFFAWVYGILSGFLYRFSCNGNVYCICLYTYMVEMLVLQFYQEKLFLSMIFVLQTVFFVFLMTQDILKLSYVRSQSK